MSDGGKGSNRRPGDNEAFSDNFDKIFGNKKPERGRFIWDKDKRDFVPASEYYAPSESNSAYVMPDIQPYQSMIDGSMITSRSKHREHLRANNCIEIGNETKYLKPKPVAPPPGLSETLRQVAAEKLRYS